MITVKVTKGKISILGHANYDEYGKDIVCASVSSIVMTSIEGISQIDNKALDVHTSEGNIQIIINKYDDITMKLINNMLNCLQELVKKYPKNIKIINREE